MEWIHIEPPICEQTPANTKIMKKGSKIKNKKSDEQIIINALKKENMRLRRKIKILKLRLCTHNRQMSAKCTNKKSKRKIKD